MAQLKDSIVSGNLRITGMTLTDTMQATIIRAPSTSGGTSYSAGTNGQILRSNGTSSYWGGLAASDIPSLNYVPKTTDGVNAALNLLSTGSSNPGLNDYYISQYANGGTTTTTYHRRPILNLWLTLRELITAETTGSGNAVTSVTIGNDGNNRKITATKGSTFSLSDHTHNYAGSSSAGGAATSANKLNTNAGSATQPVYFSGGIPVVTTAPASGAYWSTVPPVNSSGVMEIGRYLDFHATSESTNSYDLRLDASSTSLLTLRSAAGTPQFCIEGTLPRLRFKQTTSGSEYDSQNAGITAYPANTGGLNLVMQSSGLTIVGGGESPKLLYDRIITTDTNPYGSTSLQTSEQTFLTSDNHIYFVSGANGITDTAYTDWTNLKTAIFDSSGNFRPSITEKGSIGSESYEWHSGYIHNIYGLINHTKTNPTSATTYGLTFHATANTEEPKYLHTSDGVSCTLLEGTTSAQGYGVLNLGNNIASGTALNKYGVIRMYGNSSTYVQLSAGSGSNTIRFSQSASTAGSNISPGTTAVYDLGTSSLRWRNVYARSLNGNLRSAFVYDNASNFASYPWHKFAETTVIAANTDTIITFLISRTMSGGDKIGILTVRVRTGSTKIFSAGYIHFNYHDSDLNPDDFVAVYTNTANTSCKIELYCKITERYGGVIATVLKEHNRVDTTDIWTLTKYSASANGVASVPAGTGHLTMLSSKQEVLYEKTGFTRASWNTVTFSKNVFGVYKLALLIIDQCQINADSYENAATYILPLDYIKSLGVDAYPPYLTGTGWSTQNNTHVNYVGPEGDPWDVAVTFVSDTSLKFSRSGNANMATNNANVKIIGIM